MLDKQDKRMPNIYLSQYRGILMHKNIFTTVNVEQMPGMGWE